MRGPLSLCRSPESLFPPSPPGFPLRTLWPYRALRPLWKFFFPVRHPLLHSCLATFFFFFFYCRFLFSGVKPLIQLKSCTGKKVPSPPIAPAVLFEPLVGLTNAFKKGYKEGPPDSSSSYALRTAQVVLWKSPDRVSAAMVILVPFRHCWNRSYQEREAGQSAPPTGGWKEVNIVVFITPRARVMGRHDLVRLWPKKGKVVLARTFLCEFPFSLIFERGGPVFAPSFRFYWVHLGGTSSPHVLMTHLKNRPPAAPCSPLFWL